jgi:hypothetical protein
MSPMDPLMEWNIIIDEFKNIVVKLQVLTSSSKYENIYFIVFLDSL